MIDKLKNFLAGLWSGDTEEPSYDFLILDCALRYRLDARLIAAIIWQESRGMVDAGRFEEHVYYRLKATPREKLIGFVPKGLPSLNTELAWRATSWGPMQIMGDTARDLGFKGRWLESLEEPEINLELGCKLLEQLFKRASITSDFSVSSIALLKPYIDKYGVKTVQVLKWYNGKFSYPSLVLGHIDSGAYKRIYDH